MGRIIGSGENDHNGLSSSTNDNDNENAAAEDVESGTVQNDEKATVQIRNDEEAAASVVFPPKQPTSFWSRLGNWVAPIDPEYEARRLKQLTAQFESLDLKGGSAAPATSATTTTTETNYHDNRKYKQHHCYWIASSCRGRKGSSNGYVSDSQYSCWCQRIREKYFVSTLQPNDTFKADIKRTSNTTIASF